jgi:hypothetical protein
MRSDAIQCFERVQCRELTGTPNIPVACKAQDDGPSSVQPLLCAEHTDGIEKKQRLVISKCVCSSVFVLDTGFHMSRLRDKGRISPSRKEVSLDGRPKAGPRSV